MHQVMLRGILQRGYKLLFCFPLVVASLPIITNGTINIYNESKVGTFLVPKLIGDIVGYVLKYRGWCVSCQAVRALTEDNRCEVCGSDDVELPIIPMDLSIPTVIQS